MQGVGEHCISAKERLRKISRLPSYIIYRLLTGEDYETGYVATRSICGKVGILLECGDLQKLTILRGPLPRGRLGLTEGSFGLRGLPLNRHGHNSTSAEARENGKNGATSWASIRAAIESS